MVRVSAPLTTPPAVFRTPLQEKVYAALAALEIPFTRVDNDPALTMEDCAAIDAALEVKTVKTLFLCNRQQTAFYLFVTPGDKPFRSKDFGAALGVSRVSFAPTDRLQPMLGSELGATTVFSALLESAKDVRIVFDAQVLEDPRFGCTDGTNTCYMRVPTERIFRDLMAYTRRTPDVIRV